MADFPSELLAIPQPLIGFYGLDINNASHKAIFDSFNNRIDRSRWTFCFCDFFFANQYFVYLQTDHPV